jgi:hypothetical protein
MEHLEIVTGPQVTQSGSLTINSPVVTGLTTSALAGAVSVSGTGIPAGAYVLSVDSASQVTLSANATVAGSQSLTFGLEPITLAEAKAQCRVELDFLTDDAYLVALISAARILAEAFARTTFLATTYDYFLDSFPASFNGYLNRLVRQQGPSPQWLPNGAAIIDLPKPPLVSVASVKYYDPAGTLQTVDASTYTVSTGMGSRVQPLIGNVWPVVQPRIDGVVVRYTAGLSNAALVGANIKAAVKLIVSHLYENREATVSASIGAKPLPMGVEALLGAGDGWTYA